MVFLSRFAFLAPSEISLLLCPHGNPQVGRAQLPVFSCADMGRLQEQEVKLWIDSFMFLLGVICVMVQEQLDTQKGHFVHHFTHFKVFTLTSVSAEFETYGSRDLLKKTTSCFLHNPLTSAE